MQVGGGRILELESQVAELEAEKEISILRAFRTGNEPYLGNQNTGFIPKEWVTLGFALDSYTAYDNNVYYDIIKSFRLRMFAHAMKSGTVSLAFSVRNSDGVLRPGATMDNSLGDVNIAAGERVCFFTTGYSVYIAYQIIPL